MSRGKILKVRPGHDANCSAVAYMGGILVSILGYAMLWGILAFVVLYSWPRRLGTILGKGGKLALWLVPQILALAAFLYWAFTSGATNYGSVICVWPLALIMLIGMGGGWVLISRAAKGTKRAPGTVEPPPAE